MTQIITLTIPFLVGIYPLVIVFVLLSLFDRFIDWRRSVYRGAMNCTLVFAIIDGLNAASIQLPGVNEFLSAYLPFYSITMGWVIPALLGAFFGFVYSCFQEKPADVGVAS